MAIYFFESSAIVKRYANETGTRWVRQLTDPNAGHETFLVRITAVEVVSALVRKSPSIPPPLLSQLLGDLRHDLQNHYQVIEVTGPLVASAMALAEKHHLRGYDAVQLAAALEVHNGYTNMGFAGITMVSADAQLNASAMAEGLSVDDPSTHP